MPFWQVGLAVALTIASIVGLTVALTIASIVGLTWLAGRIYSNAALHLGARTRFMEAFRG